MVAVTDVKRKIKKTGEIKEGFYMDGYLAENLHGIPAFLKKDFDCVGIISGRGKVRTGKCLDKNTKVKTFLNGKKGNSKCLGEYKDGEILNTFSWDFEKKKMVESESKIIRTKESRKLYLVNFENGKKVRCSMDHKFFVKRKFCNTQDKMEWKIIELKLKDIKVGDELVCQN